MILNLTAGARVVCFACCRADDWRMDEGMRKVHF